MVQKSERFWMAAFSAILLFMLVNFDPQIGAIFGPMLLVAAMLYFFDYMFGNKIQYPILKNKLDLTSIGIGVIAYFVFLLVSMFVLPLFKEITEIVNFNAAINFYAQYIPFFSEFAPALAGNPILTYLGWGVLIPFIETLLLARYLEVLEDYMGSRKEFSDYRTWIAIAIVSSAFAFFHISAKGITNNPALMVTFVFGVLTCMLIVWRKQVIEAIILHVTANSVAVLIVMKITIFSPYLIVGLVALGFFLLSRAKFAQSILRRA